MKRKREKGSKRKGENILLGMAESIIGDKLFNVQLSSVQLLSRVRLFATP